MPSPYLYEEGGGSDLVLLVASLQERDQQVEKAAQLLAGVVHHGPGIGERQQSPKALQYQEDLLDGGLAFETLDKAGSPGFLHSQDPHLDKISEASSLTAVSQMGKLRLTMGK